jgi:hypothetical protein
MAAVLKLKPTDGPVGAVETVTPALAEEYLANMVNNRPLSETKVLEYAIAIDEGNWVVNGESLKFLADGRLFDGQHRLRACVLAAKPIETLVIRGITDMRAFATVDVGKTRSHGDVFGIAGFHQSALASSVAMGVYLYTQKRLTIRGPIGGRIQRSSPLGQSKIAKKLRSLPSMSAQVPKEELVSFAGKHAAELADATAFAGTITRGRKFMLPAVVGSCYYLFREKDERTAKLFFKDLAEGAELASNDPVHVLREKLLANATSHARLNRWTVMALIIKTWNKRRVGDKARRLFLIDDEDFPKVV